MKRRRFRNVPLPIVSKDAVTSYLSRPLHSYDFIKDAPREELLAYAHGLGMRFATDCWTHQLACFQIGVHVPSFLFFLKQGGGKSKIILDLIRYRKRTGHLLRALVLAPELLHVASWEDQIKEHAPDLRYEILLGSLESRRRLLDKRGVDLFVMNYKGLEMFMTDRVQKERGGRKRGYQKVNNEKASDFASKFNFVAFDELHRIVDRDSTYYEMFRWMAVAADYRYGLTGSPFGRDPSPLWGQFKLIDDGATFGEKIGMFHYAFFTPHKNIWSGIEWKFNPKMTPELHRVIKNRSIVYDVTEYRDMPRKLSIRVPVRLRGESLAYYDRIVDGLIEARGDYRSLGNVFIRMRQCASGFLSLRADDESRIDVQFTDNPKLEALREFLCTRPDEKILVFHEFIHSGKVIEKMLEEERIGYAAIRGGTADPAGQYNRFLSDPKCRVFVLNNQLGSESINPQYVCRRAVFYESPVDPKRRDQAEMRVWRPGQEWPVFIHDLLVLGTIEEKIWRYCKEGRDLLRAVMSGDESLVVGEEETTV